MSEILEGKLLKRKLETGILWGETSPLKLHGLNCTLYPMIRTLQTVSQQFAKILLRVWILDICVLLKLRLENSMSIFSPQSWITLRPTHALLIVALLLIKHFYNHLCMAI